MKNTITRAILTAGTLTLGLGLTTNVVASDPDLNVSAVVSPNTHLYITVGHDGQEDTAMVSLQNIFPKSWYMNSNRIHKNDYKIAQLTEQVEAQEMRVSALEVALDTGLALGVANSGLTVATTPDTFHVSVGVGQSSNKTAGAIGASYLSKGGTILRVGVASDGKGSDQYSASAGWSF